MSASYSQLLELLYQAATLSSVAELLGWDQETMMPPKAGEFRADELALISRLAHQKATDPRIGELLSACEADRGLCDDEDTSANLREIRRDYDRARRLPDSLVAEISETNSRSLEAWKKAREASDFSSFLPWLEKQVALNRRKAACLSTPRDAELYDALLEDYEPGVTCAELERIFRPLRAELVPLIDEITSRSGAPGLPSLDLRLDPGLQRDFHMLVLARIGFDLDGGRLDTSAHPFSAGLGPGDTRITTRRRENNFFDALSSTLHEAGHALYEQGLPKAGRHGQPLAEPLGLGIHESQSRLWENHVGLSRAFWQWALPEARRLRQETFGKISLDEIFAGLNALRPNLIRINSDETTYNLHIMLRFELERAMIRGELRPADLPGVWNERIKQDLGLDVPDDRRGCLQDVHWAMGSFGYFPSYTLGNLYAAQFWESLHAAVPDLDEQIARGEFGALLGWLRREIHTSGRRTPSAVLCRRLTGRALEHGPLMRHLTSKLAEVYGLGGKLTAPDRGQVPLA